jgi:methylmalonyl-CoA epimerase
LKIDKFDHVGISVKNMDNTLKFYTENLGVKKSDITDMTIPDQIRLATIKLPGASLEFVEYLNDKEVLSKYADPRADAIHHFAVFVDNLAETMSKIKKSGGTLIHETPMEIPGGVKVAFALPKASNVMIEFMEAMGGRG